MKAAFRNPVLSLVAASSLVGCGGSAPRSDVSLGPNATGPSGARPVSATPRQEGIDELLGLHIVEGRLLVDPLHAPSVLGDLAGVSAAEEQERGVALRLANRPRTAIRAHANAVLLEPDQAAYYVGLAQALRVERRLDVAVAALESAIVFEPGSGESQLLLAELFWAQARPEAAIARARVAIEAEPSLARAHSDLARWLYYVRDYEAAWHHVHRTEALGGSLPAQFLPLLEEQYQDPGN